MAIQKFDPKTGTFFNVQFATQKEEWQARRRNAYYMAYHVVRGSPHADMLIKKFGLSENCPLASEK
jgi:hypothetical protein